MKCKDDKNNQYESIILHLKKLKLEFCASLFIERNIKIEDIPHFTIDDFRNNNINEVVACVLLGEKIIKSFNNIMVGDETEALYTMIKEHYDPDRIKDAINIIHEEKKTITKDNLYRELNNDNLSHPQKCILNIYYLIVRELQSILDEGDGNSIKEREKEMEKAKREEIDGMKKKMENNCAACMDKYATHIYSSCGHLCICKSCADDYKDKCIVCREAGHPIEVKFPE